ncbi:MAG: hypothetical protein LBH43_03040 [Treponema sp.]|jgi:hypothetical protein|nr:hypothetical protein [Treponema sp.]
MLVNGCDCSIVIKTAHREMDIPYSDETLREAVSLLQEEAAIEGDGVCRGLRVTTGVTGCVVSPLTIGTAPLLLYLAMGAAGIPVYLSETRNLYRYDLSILPMEDTDQFDLIQDRGTGNSEQVTNNKERGERKLYEGCRVKGFELRIMRGEALKLKLDVTSDRPSVTCPYTDTFEPEAGERFNGDGVAYRINGQKYINIYGVTILSKKEGGTKTEIWIKRALEQGPDIPDIIDEMTITARLLRTQYEYRHFGTFRITIKRLVLVSDETDVNSVDTVIGPLRYFVADTVATEVFSANGDDI